MKSRISFSLILFSLFFISCNDIGLGESIDLQGPVCRITSHEDMEKVRREFTLAGTCIDNKSVANVSVSYENGEKIGDAVIKDNSWSIDLSFDKDQELALKVCATDPVGNISEDSVAQITLIVDEENPALKSIQIIRCNKYPVNFQAKSVLENYVADSVNTENKDFFQNEVIKIQGNMSDNYRLKSAYISVYDEDGTCILDKIENSSATAYTPEFIISQEDLTKANSKYSSGYHFLYSNVHLEDDAGNKYSERTKYFCWWPESDLVKAECVLENEGKITSTKNNTIPVNLFDDDGIKSIYYKIYKKSEWSQKKANTKVEDIFESEKADYTFVQGDSSRDIPITLSSGEDGGSHILFVVAEDDKADGSQSVWSYTYFNLDVTSDDFPILQITSPQENSSPDLTAFKFNLEGKILDKQGNCKAGLAWVPVKDKITRTIREEDITLAESLLPDFVLGNETQKTDSSGIKFIKLNLGTNSPEIIDSINYQAQTFTQNFDIQEFFKYNNEIQNETKVFILYVINEQNAEVYKTFRLGSYTGVPIITVKYNTTSINGSYTETLPDIKTMSSGDKLFISVTAIGANGLSLDSTYGIKGNWTCEAKSDPINISWTNPSSGVYTTQIGPEEGLVASERYTINLSAKDIFGNTSNVIKTITTGSVGALSKITCNQNKGTYLIKGSKLVLQAEFNESVEINGEGPKIKLTNIYINNVKNENQYAKYKSGSGTSTLQFEYVVPDNCYSDGFVTCANELADHEKINTTVYTISATDNEVASREITIDGIAPALDLNNCTPKNNTKSSIAGNNTITLKFTEQVNKESGKITIKRTDGWAIPIVMNEAEFKTYYNKMTNENKILMIGSSTGEAKVSDSTGQAVGPYVKNVQGLNLSGANVESDRDTKYVLRWDLDPHDVSSTPGTVKGLRSALESVNYHQVIYDVTDKKVSISGNEVEISGIDSSFFVNGREYEVLIDEGCFRDNAGNLNKEVKKGTYTFWDNKVAQPVIRVDKYTHGWGAEEPDENGIVQPALAENSKEADSGSSQVTRPTGFARVRIDSETPGVTIKYGSKILSVDAATALTSNTATQGECLSNELSETSANIKNISVSIAYSQNTPIVVGDSSLTVGSRTYIKAGATKTDFTNSDFGYEGAYKTVIYYKNPQQSGGTLKIQGTSMETDKTGVSLLAGYPLRNADPDDRYSKYCYKIPDTSGNGDWVLISYDFVYGWQIQSVITNWENDNHPGKEPSYGCVYYTIKKIYY